MFKIYKSGFKLGFVKIFFRDSKRGLSGTILMHGKQWAYFNTATRRFTRYA